MKKVRKGEALVLWKIIQVTHFMVVRPEFLCMNWYIHGCIPDLDGIIQKIDSVDFWNGSKIILQQVLELVYFSNQPSVHFTQWDPGGCFLVH